MKNITIRYYLVNKIKDLEKRVEPEAVWAEISGAFRNSLNGVTVYKKFKFSLDTKIKPIYFGSIQEKRGLKNFKYDNTVINNNKNQNKLLRAKMSNLEDCKDITIQHFNRININPTIIEFQSLLKQLVRGNTTQKEDYTFHYFLEKHITYLEGLKGGVNNDEVKDRTIDAYRNLRPHLNNWANTNGDLKFSHLDEKKYHEFWEFIIQKKAKAKSTIHKYQTYFIKICKVAKKEGIIFDLDLNDKNLIVNITKEKPSEKTKANLSETDLQKIIDLKIVARKTCRSEKTQANLELAKDFIIISSFTGMRWQSMIECGGRKMEQHKTKEFNFWHIYTVQEKTDTDCLTPIFRPAFEIIKANNNKFPDFSSKRITLLNMNNNIRKVLELAEIKSFELFSTKNCRNTFVTNLYKLGIDLNIVALVTHPDRKATNKSTDGYARTTLLDKAEKFVRERNHIKTKKTLYQLYQ